MATTLGEFRDPGICNLVTEVTVDTSGQWFRATAPGQLDELMTDASFFAYISSATGAVLENASDGLRVSSAALGATMQGGGASVIDVADGGIKAQQLDAGAVTTDAILDGNVTLAKLAPDAVTNLTNTPATDTVDVESSTGINTTLPAATSTDAGVLSSTDWSRFNNAVMGHINALDYGADPTGSVDSTSALQDAITAAASAGKVLWIPGGTYLQSSLLTLAATNVIMGDPGRTIIQATGSGAGAEFTMMKRPNQDCELDMFGITMRHNGAISGTPNFGESSAIDLNQATRVNIDRCEFWNCPNACISARHEASGDLDFNVTNSYGGTDNGIIGALFVDTMRCNSMSVTNNLTERIARPVSVELTTAAVHVVKNVTVTSNIFRDGDVADISATNTGIAVQVHLKTGESIDNVVIGNNQIESFGHTATNQGYAIRVEGSSDGSKRASNVTVTGNTISGWSGSGSSHVMFFKSCKRLNVTGNVISPPTWTAGAEAGVFLENSDDVTITGNTWEGVYDPAVVQLNTVLGNNANVTITGNTCQEDQVFIAGDAIGVYLIHRGKGDPNGQVAASIGSIFQRSDGSAGTSVYFKESGQFNTGWSTVAGSGSRKGGVDTVAFAATLAIDFDLGQFDNKEVTLTSDVLDIALSATRETDYELRFRQDATGYRAVFATTTGLEPTVMKLDIDPGPDAVSIVRLYYDGSTFHWG